MKRKIDHYLKEWKESRIRQPLLVRGARQVGKTFSIGAFAHAEFENLVTVNFEERPELADCFSDFDPKAIIDRISILTRSQIKPGRTLLFLDEIQECPRAITALRYFFENLPALHVIGAGSLIEFALRSENFRMPVGRVQSLFMYPLTFSEFLEAIGERGLIEYMRQVTVQTGVEPLFHERLELLLRQYLMVGGMPAAISALVESVPMDEIQRLQTGLIRTYADDFSKYASTAKHKYLKEVYGSAPRMVGKRYKYSQINPDIESKFLKEALNLLCDARCLIKICHASGASAPFAASVNERKFKIAFLDSGLMQNALGIQSAILLDKTIMGIHSGSVVEQFAAQALLAGGEPYHDRELYFWTREKRGSNAEVDFLIDIDGIPVPVEVKAGATGTLKSMRIFLDEYPNSPIGIRYSLHGLTYYDNILSIPLYMMNQTSRLFRENFHRL